MAKSEASRAANRAYKARCRQDPEKAEKLRAERREYMRGYREREGHAARMRRYRYGITHEQFVEMYYRQNGRCAVCRTELSVDTKDKKRDACVDHCHETGKVRGLLCRKCNLALGHLDDDPVRIRALAEYAARHASGGDA